MKEKAVIAMSGGVDSAVAVKSTAENTVTLGPDSALFKKSLTAKNINLIAYPDLQKTIARNGKNPLSADSSKRNRRTDRRRQLVY
ncbi:MAG: hypothetical protein FWB89_09000 [Treponema sp.]|nr:hypothetical protein [Treponema sp.]